LRRVTRILRSATSRSAIICSTSQKCKGRILKTESIQVFAKRAEFSLALQDNAEDQL
jgi:hypothetical protein